MTIFLLSQWYPNKYDQMEGLFVRKHAEAIAKQGNKVHVFHVVINKKQKEIEIVRNDDGSGVIEHIAYKPKEWGLWKFMKLSKTYKQLMNIAVNDGDKPDIVHLNVLTKVAIVGYYAATVRFKVPYVVTEHWSGYLKANGGLKSGSIKSQLANIVSSEAACVMPVSGLLMNAMQELGLQAKRWKVVPNVVDDFFYWNNSQLRREVDDKYRLLHVSCFDNKAKNVKGIVDAIDILRKERQDFHLTILGTGRDYEGTVKYARKLGLIGDYISFHGERTPREVKTYMNESDLFVLFSNYETAGVVLQEAMVCGLPVVTTDVGIAADEIDESMGEKVEIGNTKDLAKKLDLAMRKLKSYDRERMRAKAVEYSYANVGKQIQNIYIDAKKGDN